MDADAVRQFKVRNENGDMVPLGALATVRDDVGPVFIVRYNMMVATAINGATCPRSVRARSSKRLKSWRSDSFPATWTYEWSELSYMEKEAEPDRFAGGPTAKPIHGVYRRRDPGVPGAGRSL